MVFTKVSSVLKAVTLWLISWFLVILLLPFVPVFLILIPYKFLVNQIVRRYHPGWIPLKGVDVTFLEKSTNKNYFKSNLGGIAIVAGDVQIEGLRKKVQDKLLNVLLPQSEIRVNKKYKYDRLRRYTLEYMYHYYWSEELKDVDPKNFVKEFRAEKTDLERFMSTWVHKGYKPRRPQWEVLLYKDDDQYAGKSVIAIKIAHSIGDTYSLRTLFSIVMDTEAPMFATESQLSTKTWITPLEKLTLALIGPYLFLKNLRYVFISTSDPLIAIEKFEGTVLNLFTVELSIVKTIRRAYGCKFNDVILAVIGSSLRRYLLESNSESKLSKYITFICPREVPGRPEGTCNHVAPQFFPVPIKSPDPKERLRQLTKKTNEIFKYPSHKVALQSYGVSYYYPSFFFPKSEPKGKLPVACCSLAAIPDLQDSRFYESYPVEGMLGVGGQQYRSAGLIVSTMTTGSVVNISLIGNVGVFQNADGMSRFRSYFLEELKVLLETVKQEV